MSRIPCKMKETTELGWHKLKVDGAVLALDHKAVFKIGFMVP